MLEAAGAFSPSHYYAQLFPTLPYINQLEALNLVHALLYLITPNPSDFNMIINTDNLVSKQMLSLGMGMCMKDLANLSDHLHLDSD